MTRPVKRSLTLRGHRTSVSLEDDFWRAFREIAEEKDIPINALAAEIDAQRDLKAGLATAIRLYVLNHYRSKTAPS
ncbi:MAG: ribbon-helix-helix domain-containing protein [Shimia sp.]|uniref:ribbon-helix-helix domain-containing protein n=1 Tax=Shimia sp. TaxID=1954381 RepID=UPI004057F1F1